MIVVLSLQIILQLHEELIGVSSHQHHQHIYIIYKLNYSFFQEHSFHCHSNLGKPHLTHSIHAPLPQLHTGYSQYLDVIDIDSLISGSSHVSIDLIISPNSL